MSTAYLEFLERKVVAAKPMGLAVVPPLNPHLFDWQSAVVGWALRRGRAALFEDCGLGKSLQELAWGEAVADHTGRPVLLLTTLAVAQQMIREGRKFGVPVAYGRDQAEADTASERIVVTNYERLDRFDASVFGGVIADESSVLKSYMGATKRAILEAFRDTPYKLAATATPAPNDYLELGNHSEFLGALDSNEMLSRWFINDTMQAGGYRLKGHAEAGFWRWVASWAVCISKPSDLRRPDGTPYSDDGFNLPPLHLVEHIVDVDITDGAADGELFRTPTLSATTLHQEMRRTADARARRVAELIGDSTDAWAVWCNTDYEADALRAALPDLEEVRGSHSLERKEAILGGFSDGTVARLLTKPSIAGFGLNFQHCHNTAFVGLSYSYEQLYQALRRFYRFGQTEEVRAHLIVAATETGVLQRIREKQAQHQDMQRKMVEAMSTSDLGSTARDLTLDFGVGVQSIATSKDWTLYHGDCVDVTAQMESDTIGFGIHSPPFSNLYIYSDSLRDMGNTEDDEAFFAQYEYLIAELYRTTVPGRICAVHCKDLPRYKGRDGAAGLSDFPGEIIRRFSQHGWQYHSRVTIWKDPVIEMQRTKNHGLLYKELCKDSSCSRQGMADYLLAFRKWVPGLDAFPDPVTTGGERFDHYVGLNPPDPTAIAQRHGYTVRPNAQGKWPHHNPFPVDTAAYREWSILVWQIYASPVWFDIDQTDVLNFRMARDNEDERHICPLQLDVIERAIHLWSNPGDLVYSPFAGIGSEGYVALQTGRRFVGAELKESYWRHAQRHLASTVDPQVSLFGEAA